MPLVQKQFRTVDEGFAYIESFTNLERNHNTSIRSYRLDRMRALLELFDNPHEGIRLVHIAGTKGKGSTGAFLASILDGAGHKCGFYSSPHVSSYTERITLAGRPFESALYVRMINRIAERLSELAGTILPEQPGPTTFELLTLLGFLIFRETGCEWAVVETGIGGRLDATNVIRPEVCLLTPVEREHAELLGGTLPRIAGEKAGIIKPGVAAFSGFQKPEVRNVFEETAAKQGAPIEFLADLVSSIQTHLDPEHSEVDFEWADGRRESFELGMPGEVQAENAALALVAARRLSGREGETALTLPPEAVRRGLRRARLPGRMELFALDASVRKEGGPYPAPRDSAAASEQTIARVVLDAAHTPVSVARLLASFKRMFPGDAVLIFGSILGKDPEMMADVLAAHFRRVFVSTPGTFKKSDPAAVAGFFADRNPRTRLILDPRSAFEAALQAAGPERLPILVTGSFYMVAEIRALLC